LFTRRMGHWGCVWIIEPSTRWWWRIDTHYLGLMTSLIDSWELRCLVGLTYIWDIIKFGLRKGMKKNHLPHKVWLIWILGDAFWAHQCTRHILHSHEWHFLRMVWCRNPSLGLRPRLRCCEVAGAKARGSSGVTSHTPRSARKC
jgi:hypothetical protein